MSKIPELKPVAVGSDEKIEGDPRNIIYRTTNIYTKLNLVRVALHNLGISKSGRNNHKNYDYFEMKDFLPQGLELLNKHGLCGMISFERKTATLTLINCDSPAEKIVFTSPMASAEMLGALEIQKAGAVQTYQRRYLWMLVFEIIENDILDSGAAAGVPKPKLLPRSPAPSWKDSVISPAQATLVLRRLETVGMSAEKFCKKYEINSIAELPAPKMKDALAALEAYGKKKAEVTAVFKEGNE